MAQLELVTKTINRFQVDWNKKLGIFGVLCSWGIYWHKIFHMNTTISVFYPSKIEKTERSKLWNFFKKMAQYGTIFLAQYSFGQDLFVRVVNIHKARNKKWRLGSLLQFIPYMSTNTNSFTKRYPDAPKGTIISHCAFWSIGISFCEAVSVGRHVRYKL